MWQAITDLIDVVEGSDEEDQIILLSSDSDVNVSTCNITHQSNDHTTAEDNNNERERSYDDHRYCEEDENEEEEGGGILGELNYMLGGVLFGNNDEEDGLGLGLTLEEIEAARRCELEETFTEPLVVTLEEGGGQTTAEDVGAERIDNTTTYKTENDGRDNDDANDTSHDHDDEDYEDYDDYDDYAQLSRDEYLCEQNQLSQFLETFKVEEHTQEISELLSTSPANNDDDDGETTTTSLSPLQIHFQTLVPQTV